MQTLSRLSTLTEERIASAFKHAAAELLLRHRLLAFGKACRLLEIEFYLFSPNHPDPFAHCHEIQGGFARWYFHRVGKGYRNGSFKGLDLTFGSAQAFGGVLIRSLADEQDRIICGPSLCVDFLISSGNCESVRALDETVGALLATDGHNDVRLVPCDETPEQIYQSARVGLSTAGLKDGHDGENYIDRPYRYLIRPRAIKKGRPQLIQGLAQAGFTHEEIRQLTGSPRKSIEKYAGAPKQL